MTAVWVAVMVAVLALAYYGMWRGWQGRARRQADLPEPQWLEPADVPATQGAIAGTYVSTTSAGQWLDRIAAYGLGTLSRVTVWPQDGSLLIAREGAQSFQIPAADLLGVRRERGIAGKVRDRDGIVVMSWRLGDRDLDTGIRPDHAAEGIDLERTVESLMKGAQRV